MKNISKKLQISGIYCIINLVNHKKYIGSSKCIYTRLLKHRSLLRKNKHENSHLQSAFNLYKEHNFEFFILEECPEEKLLEREQFYIDKNSPEYNLTLKVERNILSPESRLKQSNTRKQLFKLGILTPTKWKPIYQYDLDGNFLQEFRSLDFASRETNISKSAICRNLNGTYTKGGNFLWSYTKADKIPERKALDRSEWNYHRVPIRIEDIVTKEVLHFASKKDAAIYLKLKSSVSITQVLKSNSLYKKRYRITTDCLVDK